MVTVSHVFAVEIATGKRVEQRIFADWVWESNYGADADGNRGVGCYLLDDLYPETAVDMWTCSDGNTLTKAEADEAYEAIMEMAETDYGNDLSPTE